LDLEGVEEAKSAMENMREEMCSVIKEKIFMKVSEEA
jgi:hypothetical protein